MTNNNGYTDRDRAAFEAKDRLNAYMSALKAASTNNQGLGKEYNVILEEADRYYAALMGAKNNIDHKPINGNCEICSDSCGLEEKTNYPTPNPQELNVLMKIAKEYSKQCPEGYKVDFDLICKAVYSEFEKYPQNEKSISKILYVIKRDDVLIKEK